MDNSKYNGWSNYETWLYNLYLNHDYYYEVVKDYDDDEGVTSAGWLANYLEDEADELLDMAEYPKDGFFADMINASVARVNFYEIAKSIIDEIE